MLKAKKKQGIVRGNMIRTRRKAWALSREKGDNFAQTRFFTSSLGDLDPYLNEADIAPRTLLLFRPSTGRTHQLRVAAKSVGLALAGDKIYRDGDDPSRIDRMYLHSTGLYVPPSNDLEEICVWSPLATRTSFWNTQGSQQFQIKLRDLAKKHCDCDCLLDQLESNLTSFSP